MRRTLRECFFILENKNCIDYKCGCFIHYNIDNMTRRVWGNIPAGKQVVLSESFLLKGYEKSNKRRYMKFLNLLMLCVLFVSCMQEEWAGRSEDSDVALAFRLSCREYDGEQSRSAMLEDVKYDRVFYYVVDEDGELAKDFKSRYDASAAEIRIEGLHDGNYRLLVLGIRGDERKDRAVINELQRASDCWLSFPADLHKPLEAEYFYSQTPFTVTVRQTSGGKQETASLDTLVEQRRIMSRVDFDFVYNNPYVKYAVVSKTLSVTNARFFTSFSGDGTFGGESDGQMDEIDLNSVSTCCFMPTVGGMPVLGELHMSTRNYKGYDVVQTYTFIQPALEPNRWNRVETQVKHPDDKSGVMFLTRQAYEAGSHQKILQDDEPKSVYTDQTQRMFDTSQPLQLSLTDEGQLHARFYSPRSVSRVLVKALIPSVSEEYVELAYFDSIPAFADFFQALPMLERETTYKTESGRLLELSQMEMADLVDVRFKVESDDDYWQRLQRIKYGVVLRWGLYGGDPDLPDGGPSGNWMGIRPVHCRESVAFFLNYSSLLDMPELEQLLRDNPDKLYDDNKQPVSPETVLQKMRTKYRLNVGLIYEGNGVSGLGGGSAWGVAQWIYLGHYNNAYTCSLAIHELGHVMGYDHSSAFTYGPWAMELINNFYVDHLKELPVDSPSYLDSANNPCLYN